MIDLLDTSAELVGGLSPVVILHCDNKTVLMSAAPAVKPAAALKREKTPNMRVHLRFNTDASKLRFAAVLAFGSDQDQHAAIPG